jgi:hypothetical protein
VSYEYNGQNPPPTDYNRPYADDQSQVYYGQPQQHASGAYQGYPGLTPGYAAYPAQPATNTLALVSLITATLGVSIVAVITGHIALSKLKTSGEQGKGMAIAGLVIGYLGLAAVALALISTIIYFGSIFAFAALLWQD